MTSRTKPPLKAPPDDTPEPHDPAEDVAAAIAVAIGEDPTAMVVVQREDAETKQWKHLRKYTPAEFDVDAVREQFGGGVFRVRIKNAKGQFLGSVRRFDIEGEPLAPEHARPIVGTMQPGATESRLMEAMLTMMTGVMTAIAERPRDTPDPVALVKEMAEASARGTRELAEMVGLRNELSANATKGGDVAQALELLRTGMKMGREMAGSGDGDGLGRLMDSVGPLIERLTRTVPASAGAVAASTTPQPPAVAPAPKHPLVAALEMLTEAAASGSQQPEAWAEIVAERVPGLIESLDAAVAEAGGIAALMLYAERQDARIKPHLQFIERAVSYLLDDEPAPDDEPPPPPDEETSE